MHHDQAIQIALRERLHAAYASGLLDPAMRLLVETQVALRQDAKRDLDLAEELVGILFESEEPASLSLRSLEQVMEQVGEGGMDQRPEHPVGRAARAASTVIDEILHLPKPVQDYALEAIGSGGWTFAGPGLRTLPLETGSGSKAEILRAEPGRGSPRHSHTGGEYTLVLAGALTDERAVYRAGDVAFASPSVTHRPVANMGEVCYCLAVTDAPLAFTGALGLLQKLWRQ